MSFTKLSFAALLALAAVGEARHQFGMHPKRYLGTGSPDKAVTVTVNPVPLSTGPASLSPVSAPPSGSSASGEDVTLTYTLGTGTSTQVVTTTLHYTSYDTTYVVPTAAAGNEDIGSGDEPTTTTSLTSTSTAYVTVLAATPSLTAGTLDSDTGSEGCAGQATVTVTEKETVTVTATVSASSGIEAGAVIPAATPGSNDSAEPTTVVYGQPAESSPAGKGEGEGEGQGAKTYKYPPPPGAFTSSAPYPISEVAQSTSSGFLTSTRRHPLGRPRPTGYF